MISANFQSTTEVDHTTKILVICVCVVTVVIVIAVLGLICRWKKRRSRDTAKKETGNCTKAPKQHDDDGGDIDNDFVVVNKRPHIDGPVRNGTVKALEDACYDQNEQTNEEECLEVLIGGKS